jgi:UDP-N-acetylmuramoyl-L-alanyl-D-glutamate--2,6-diaminopimelate ligase
MMTAVEKQTTGTSLAELKHELARVNARVHGDASVRVLDVRHDSRRVKAGDLFVARSGGKSEGLSFVHDAVKAGAAAVMIARGTNLPDVDIPILEVSDIRVALAFAAEAVQGHPSRSLDVIGITGTNGKTTTSFLLAHAISVAGGRAARLGTLGYAFGDDVVDSPLTTPEADEISRYLARARDAGATHMAMEASSHALTQARVEALRFRAAVFTNLTQDHLDYHATMEAYASAKLRLFTDLTPGVAIVNVDDEAGRRIATATRSPVVRVSKHPGADVFPLAVSLESRGISGKIQLPSGAVELESRLVGEHNLDNLLATLAVVDALGLDVVRAAREMAHAPMVPGRLERCDEPADDLVVLVDYAHTPDALERALVTCRTLARGDVIAVFGCGGDRDPEKRPRMGDAVGRLATRAIVTNDNPRSEDPKTIADAIERGLSPHRIPYTVELDRALAIEQAIVGSTPGDVVLIAGKGHEPYQILGPTTRPFDDRKEARRSLELWRNRGKTS